MSLMDRMERWHRAGATALATMSVAIVRRSVSYAQLVQMEQTFRVLAMEVGELVASMRRASDAPPSETDRHGDDGPGRGGASGGGGVPHRGPPTSDDDKPDRARRTTSGRRADTTVPRDQPSLPFPARKDGARGKSKPPNKRR